MPKGRVARQDDTTAESLKVSASKKIDRGMLNTMIGEEGPLPAGALPGTKAASEAGSQALLKALDDDKANVSKAPKPKKTKDEPENVEPKTILQRGPQKHLFPSAVSAIL